MEAIVGSSLLHTLVAIGSAIYTLFQSFKFVQEGSLGLKLRFGKVIRNKDGTPKIIHPGFAWLIPYVDTLRRRHVRQQEVTLDEQIITLQSGLTFRVAGALYFRVVDIYKALFEIDQLDESIEQLSMGMLRDEVAKHSNHHDLNDTAKIAKDIFAQIKERTDQWGIELIDFRLTTVAPTSESAPIVNLEAAANMRSEVLKKVAGELGTTPEQLIATGMAAILVGAPLVATSSVSTTTNVRETAPNKSEEEDKTAKKPAA